MKFFLTVLILVSAFFFFSLNPEFYFSEKKDFDSITIYLSEKNDFDFSKPASIAKSALDKIGFSKGPIKVFVASSRFEFFFFTYGKKNIKYWVNPINGKVFLNVCSYSDGRFEMKDFPKASADYEVAKAAVAASFRLSREVLSYAFLDTWRIIGLASYYSGEMPLYPPMDFCSPKKENEFEEFENMMIMKYMIENMKLKTDSALEENYLRESLIKEARPYLCKP
ncbi:MAG: hypothetical protein GX447_04155 [Elusimicrobia bacterium]|nr:hypothetical protein [Elusimicrobiota bacterium]